MTTRQIAQAVGKPESTVKGWVKKTGAKNAAVRAKVDAAGHGKAADYDLSETVAIIETGLGKNAAAIYRQNAEQNQPTAFAPTAGSLLTEKDLSLISTLTAGIVSKIFENLNGRMANIETRIDARQAILPPPQIKPRDHINMIVREYVAHKGGDHREAWNGLYRNFGYRTNTNPAQCAKNRGMTILDYIEAEGQIEVLEAVAMEIYGGAA